MAGGTRLILHRGVNKTGGVHCLAEVGMAAQAHVAGFFLHKGRFVRFMGIMAL